MSRIALVTSYEKHPPTAPCRSSPNRAISQYDLPPHFARMALFTGRTILGEQGHPRDVLERQLAHIDAKHVRAYDQGDRLEARRVVMQQWADYLDGLCSDTNVTNLHRSAEIG